MWLQLVGRVGNVTRHKITPGMIYLQGMQLVTSLHCMFAGVVPVSSNELTKEQNRWMAAAEERTVGGSFAHLVWSFAMVMLIHVICNCIDVKGTDHFSSWEALL